MKTVEYQGSIAKQFLIFALILHVLIDARAAQRNALTLDDRAQQYYTYRLAVRDVVFKRPGLYHRPQEQRAGI